MKKISLILAVLSFVVLSGVGCINIGPAANGGDDGGVFKSIDKGENWAQSNKVPTSEGVGHINGINVMDLVVDPQDDAAIYLASAGKGLFYTWDNTKSWKYVEGLGVGYVNSIIIDHKDKCTLFAALENKIWKSIDCGRSWKSHYFDTREGVYVSKLAIDPADSRLLYAGLSKGELLRSLDGGLSWSVIKRFINKVVELEVHPKNSNIVFVGLESDGLWKSSNKGATWVDLREKMKNFRNSGEVYDFDMTKEGDTMYLTSKYGVIVSKDVGESWEGIKLLTPPSETRIYSFAVNPNNYKEIYYATASTFYSSFDAGVNWVTKKLPTTRAGTALLVHPKDGNILYLGTRQFKK